VSSGRPSDADRTSRPVRRLYLRVLIVQAIALAALWWLQSSFGGG
jgi:hypothetical protein